MLKSGRRVHGLMHEAITPFGSSQIGYMPYRARTELNFKCRKIELWLYKDLKSPLKQVNIKTKPF